MVQDVNLTSQEWCNIVFEGKNKKYGAYYLRKTSNKRHIRALLAVIILVLAIIFIPMLIDTVKPKDKVVEVELGEASLSDLDLKKELPEEKVIEEFKAPPPPEIRATIAFVPPVIVEKVTKETEIPPTEKIIESDAAIGKTTVDTDNKKGEHIDDLDKVVIPTPKEPEKEEIFKAVEQQPQYPGGNGELMKYLGNNLKYPPAAAEQGIQGRVVVQFVVSKTGAISDVRVIQPLHPSCDKEAIRLISSMPKWIPGKQNGNPVNVYYTIPIRFKLQEQQ